MKILSAQEGREWLVRTGKGYIQADKPWPIVTKFSYSLPIDTGKKTAVARALASTFAGSSEGLFWIRDWSAFSSSANVALFYGYRKYLGDERLLIDAPFHLFSRGDTTTLESLLGMSLYFYGDSVLLATEWDAIVTTSNDEFIDLYGGKDEELSYLKRSLDELGLQSR